MEAVRPLAQDTTVQSILGASTCRKLAGTTPNTNMTSVTYQVIESQAADFYGLDKTPIDVEIEHAGQIVKAAMTNKSLYTNVPVTAVFFQVMVVQPPYST